MPANQKVELFPVRLLGYRVASSNISLQIQSPTTRPEAVELLNQIQHVENRSKGLKAHVVAKIEDADTNTMTRFAAELASLSSKRNNVNLLLHIPKSRRVAKVLFDLVGGKDLFLTIFPTWKTDHPDNHDREKNVQEVDNMLTILGDLTHRYKDEILYELTTFKNEGGATVEGKRTLDEVSDRQLEVVLAKLRKSLSSVETNQILEKKEDIL